MIRLPFIGKRNKFFILAVVCILSLVLISTGCTEKNQGKIFKTGLTKIETNLLNAVGIQSYFVFDYYLPDQNYRAIRIWMEFYQNGEYQGQRFATQTPIDGEKDQQGRLIFSLYQYSDEEFRLISSFIKDGGVISASNTLPSLEADSARGWSGIEEKKILSDQPILLFTIVENKDTILGTEFHELQDYTGDPEDFIPENDHLLVFKCMFIKEK